MLYLQYLALKLKELYFSATEVLILDLKINILTYILNFIFSQDHTHTHAHLHTQTHTPTHKHTHTYIFAYPWPTVWTPARVVGELPAH